MFSRGFFYAGFSPEPAISDRVCRSPGCFSSLAGIDDLECASIGCGSVCENESNVSGETESMGKVLEFPANRLFAKEIG